MKGKLLTLALVALMASALVLSLVACNKTESKSITAFEITAPTKTDYTVGEDLDLGGLTAKVIFDNSEEQEIAVNKLAISGYDKTVEGEQTVTVKYTDTENGKNTDYTKTFKVNVAAHSHAFAAEWTSDADNHWHAATCAHTTEKSDLAAHTFTWVVDKAATYDAEGSRHEECSVCGCKKGEAVTINKLVEVIVRADANSKLAANCAVSGDYSATTTATKLVALLTNPIDGQILIKGEPKEGYSFENWFYSVDDGETWEVIMFASAYATVFVTEVPSVRKVIFEARSLIKGTVTINEDYNGKTYDGTAATITSADYQKNCDGEITITWYDGNYILDEAPVNAGTYSVSVYVEKSKTHSHAYAKKEFTIAKKALTGTIAFEKAYDGDKKFAEQTLDASNGVVAGDDIRVVAQKTSANVDATLDNRSWSFSVGAVLVVKNYDESALVVTAKITKAKLHFTTLEFEYNGEDLYADDGNETVVTTAMGLVANEEVTFYISEAKTAASELCVNVGTYTVTSLKMGLHINKGIGTATNYEWDGKALTLIIKPKKLTNLELTTKGTWAQGSTTTITLTNANGMAGEDKVYVTITHGNYQDEGTVTYDLVLGTAAQGKEKITITQSGTAYKNYELVATNGKVGTITVTRS